MLTIDKQGGNYFVSIEKVNRLDVLSALLIKKKLFLLFDNKRNVVLDLKNIIFVDTEGFNVLLKAFEYARNKKCGFYLQNVSDELTELMHIVELWNKIEPHLIKDELILQSA